MLPFDMNCNYLMLAMCQAVIAGLPVTALYSSVQTDCGIHMQRDFRLVCDATHASTVVSTLVLLFLLSGGYPCAFHGVAQL